MSLAELPIEIIAYILIRAAPSSIKTCRQVCRSFRDIISNDQHIQYILELDSCGYVEPATPRKELNYVERAERIRETRARWLQPSRVEPKVIPLPHSTRRSPTYEYADGIYVRGFSSPSGPLTRRLDFYRLPSRNKGTGYAHWCHADLGLDARDFGICPKQDLLVLLEVVTIHVEETFDLEEHYRIHLRTMMTNEPHPAAKRSLGSVLDYRLSVRSLPERSFNFQILGRLLAIVFCSKERSSMSYLVIWDWTTGLKLACLELPGGQSSSFSFISEDYFVIPRNSISYDLVQSVPRDHLGRLDICSLRSDEGQILSYDDCCIASFMLPDLKEDQRESCLHLRCAPTPTPRTSYIQRDPYPRLYDVAPESQLLCVNVFISMGVNFPFDESYGTLFVPSRALIDMISQPSHRVGMRILWHEWAAHTSWVDTREFATRNERYMYGQRTAVLCVESGFPGAFYNAMTILDFDQQRIKARLSASEVTGDVCVPKPIEGSVDNSELPDEDDWAEVHHRSCGRSFFEGENVPKRRFAKTTIALPAFNAEGYGSIMMDDEHVVVRMRGGGGTGYQIVVYNF